MTTWAYLRPPRLETRKQAILRCERLCGLKIDDMLMETEQGRSGSTLTDRPIGKVLWDSLREGDVPALSR